MLSQLRLSKRYENVTKLQSSTNVKAIFTLYFHIYIYIRGDIYDRLYTHHVQSTYLSAVAMVSMTDRIFSVVGIRSFSFIPIAVIFSLRAASCKLDNVNLDQYLFSVFCMY